jgi:hypothetical protein
MFFDQFGHFAGLGMPVGGQLGINQLIINRDLEAPTI